MGVFYHWNRLRRKGNHRMERRDTIKEAIERIKELMFPLYVMRFDSFRELEKLMAFEDADKRDLLIVKTSVPAVLSARQRGLKIAFMSHQWLAWKHPDPNCIQYRTMVNGTWAVAKRFDWNADHVCIWLDYHSIPQKHGITQHFAIQSLPLYASLADVFIVTAPSSQHADTGQLCNESSYKSRAWCRLEVFSHFCRRGFDAMFVCKEPN